MSPANKDDKLIIRIAPGLKKRIESTAKRQGKTVSDFVRDIISIFVDKNHVQYLETLNRLCGLLNKQRELQEQIYLSQNPQEVEKMMSDLTYINQMIYEDERYILEYLNSKEIK